MLCLGAAYVCADSQRFMPGILQRKFATNRDLAARALETLAEHAHEILETWQKQLLTLGLDAKVLIPEGVDFGKFAHHLRRGASAGVWEEIQLFGETLARRCDRLDHAVAAFNRLFEACLQFLATSRTEYAHLALALAKLHAEAGPLLVSGYTGQWVAGYETRVEASLSGAEASAYVTRVHDQERKRLSRDLHDEVGHDLIIVKLYLEMLLLEAGDYPAVQPRLVEAVALVSHAIDSVRRIGQDLGPAIFDDLGFLPAIKSYIGHFSARTAIPVALCAEDVPEDIPMSHRAALYRLLQGALSNILQHASAKNVTVSLTSTRDSSLGMIIEDDGVGFDTESDSGPQSLGLKAMRDRVEDLEGSIHIRSKRGSPGSKGHGTRIEIDLPLPG